MNQLYQFLLRPWFLSFIFTIILIILIPFGKTKYNTSIIGRDDPARYNEYNDLNLDGKCEKIVSLYNPFSTSILVQNNNMSIIDQWNFSGKFPEYMNYLSFMDITGDGKKEILAFYYRNDSLFLLGINPFYNKGFLFIDLFVEKLHQAFGKTIFQIIQTEWNDYNSDGISDLYVLLTGGFAIEPRNIYRIDMASKMIIKTPLRYANLTRFFLDDINNDGQKEILLSTNSPSNVSDKSLPYSDHFSWLIVLDKDLNFAFPPLKLWPANSGNQLFPILVNGVKTILSYQIADNDSVIFSCLSTYNSGGTLLNSVKKNYTSLSLLPSTFALDENSSVTPFLYGQDGQIFSISPDLSLEPVGSTGKSMSFLGQFNFDPGDVPELLFFHYPTREFLITRSDFSPILSFIIEDYIPDMPAKISTIETSKNHSLLYLSNRHGAFAIECKLNPWFYFRFPLYLIIYFLFLLLFYYLRKIWEAQAKEKYFIEQNMLQLQLSSLSSQLDPHLTFNLLNSISYVLLKHEGKELHESFTRLTNYIRNTLVNSDRLIVSLSEELEFVNSYLFLQKARQGTKLEWSVASEPDVPGTFQVPRMCIQNLVENSIKHGLKPKPEGGKIRIGIQQSKGNVVISVSDDGVGKSTNSNYSSSTGKGLSLIRQFFVLLNKYNSEKASVSLIFPEDEAGNPLGARAEIIIPLNYKFQ